MTNPLAEFGKTAQGLSRNPLGIIALFIVLVYGIAALVLSTSATNLQPSERAPLVWFLVTFPLVVLGVFGWLVSRHHSKLYSPRDYQSDGSFLSTIAPEVQRIRLAAEVATFEADVVSESPSSPTQSPTLLPAGSTPSASKDPRSSSHNAIRVQTARETVLLAQELAIRQLEAELGTPIDRQQSVAAGGKDFLFDGTAIQEGVLTAVEVKVLRAATARKNIRAVTAQFLALSLRLYEAAGRQNTKFILAVVLDGSTDSEIAAIGESAAKEIGQIAIPLAVRVYSLGVLREAFGVAPDE